MKAMIESKSAVRTSRYRQPEEARYRYDTFRIEAGDEALARKSFLDAAARSE